MFNIACKLVPMSNCGEEELCGGRNGEMATCKDCKHFCNKLQTGEVASKTSVDVMTSGVIQRKIGSDEYNFSSERKETKPGPVLVPSDFSMSRGRDYKSIYSR